MSVCFVAGAGLAGSTPPFHNGRTNRNKYKPSQRTLKPVEHPLIGESSVLILWFGEGETCTKTCTEDSFWKSQAGTALNEQLRRRPLLVA